MGDRNSLAKPLLPRRRTTPSPPDAPGGGFLLRLAFLSLIGALAVWATREASRGFRLTVVNDLPRDSRAGQRFDLFYVSNDAATRALLNASDFVEGLLYDVGGERKKVSHVTLRLAAVDFPGGVSVAGTPGEEGGFVVDLSSSVMDASDADAAVRSAVLRGMARVWVWDNGVPGGVLSGVVEYIALAAGFGGENQLEAAGSGMIRCGRDHGHDNADWFADKDPRFVARLLGRCEEEERGFIRRLNGAMRNGWHDRTVEDALGKPAHVCLCVPDN